MTCCVRSGTSNSTAAHYALALEGAFARAQDLLRALTAGVVALLGLSDSLHPDYETLLGLPDDFIGADLRRADLAGLKLDGLWWSETSTSRPSCVDVKVALSRWLTGRDALLVDHAGGG
jgi:hypothetical protein